MTLTNLSISLQIENNLKMLLYLEPVLIFFGTKSIGLDKASLPGSGHPEAKVLH